MILGVLEILNLTRIVDNLDLGCEHELVLDGRGFGIDTTKPEFDIQLNKDYDKQQSLGLVIVCVARQVERFRCTMS
jgi:hypothetical protein